MKMNAPINNIRHILTEEEAMGIIPQLLVEGSLRRLAAARLERADEVEGEAERVLEDALSDGDQSGGGAMNLFLDAEQLRKEAAALEEAAAAVERAMRLVEGKEAPAAEEEAPAVEVTPEWSLEQRRAHADLWGMGHWVND